MANQNVHSVAFGKAEYDALRATYRRWWDGTLGRPIVPIVTTGHASCREASPYPMLKFITAWDESYTPEMFVDAYDALFSTQKWHGDAFPAINFDAFGPGVLAAFLGSKVNSRKETVWFEPVEKDMPLEEMHFEFDPDNAHLRRVLSFYEAGMKKWHGSVVLGMADLGGIMDVLASFRGTDNLLMDLYDDPDEVLRCIGEIQEAWFKAYDAIMEVLAPEAQGYTQWFPLYGEKPGYILQSDFSYMISPAMFDTFVAPELASSAARLERAIYHLDGIGEIPHLDSLLKIKDIHGIQWVPGAGEPSTRDWTELVTRILEGGKKLLTVNQNADGSPIAAAKDPGELFFMPRSYGPEDYAEAKRYGAMFGIDVNV